MVKASFENVEKVVKPPHSPTVRNNPHEVISEAFRLNNPQSKPIIKQPNRLTKSVAQGNPLLIPFMTRETRYLAIPPIKLPAPTAIIFLMVSGNINPNLSASREEWKRVYIPEA